MVFRIGGENLAATAFYQLLDQGYIGPSLSFEELEEYRQRCQYYLDNFADDVFHEIFPNYIMTRFDKDGYLIPPPRRTYLLNLPPLDFIAHRNPKLFYSADIDSEPRIILMTKKQAILKPHLESLFPKDMVAIHILLNKIKIEK